VNAYDGYSNANWSYSNELAVGSVVNVAPIITTLPSVSPYQTGGTIVFDLSGGVASEGIGGITLQGMNHAWWMLVPSTMTQITLPTPPASVVNPYIAGNTYAVSTELNFWANQTYNSVLNAYLVPNGINNNNYDPLAAFRQEHYQNYTGVPYTY